MTPEKYIRSIEMVIAEHQRVQGVNPPSSEQWQNASAEINRLAALIVKTKSVCKEMDHA
jgi:hypothetical protein